MPQPRPLTIVTQRGPNGGGEVSLEAELVADAAGCVRVKSNRETVLIWPQGYTARSNRGVEVLDASGRVVARSGATVQLSGAPAQAPANVGRCGGTYFFAITP